MEKTCGLWLFLLSAGNVDDCTEAVPLLKLLPDLKDCDILADKAYGTKEIRTYLHDQFARYTIPPKVNTKQPWPFDKEMYKRRNVIERFFNRLKEFRRAETRYDSFLAFVMVAASCVAFSILHI
ncbi:MAG: transposase [Oscillospiraceae bacterium]